MPIVEEPIAPEPAIPEVIDPVVVLPPVVDPIIIVPEIIVPVVDPIAVPPVVTNPIEVLPEVISPVPPAPIVVDPILEPPIIVGPLPADPIDVGPLVPEVPIRQPIVDLPDLIINDPMIDVIEYPRTVYRWVDENGFTREEFRYPGMDVEWGDMPLIITIADSALLAGTATPFAASGPALPEPSTITLTWSGIFLLLSGQRRRRNR